MRNHFPPIRMLVFQDQIFISSESIFDLLEIAEVVDKRVDDLRKRVCTYKKIEHQSPYSVIGDSTAIPYQSVLLRTIVYQGVALFDADGTLELLKQFELPDWTIDELRDTIHDGQLKDQGLNTLIKGVVNTNYPPNKGEAE